VTKFDLLLHRKREEAITAATTTYKPISGDLSGIFMTYKNGKTGVAQYIA